MGRQFKIGVCVAGGILFGPPVFLGALAQDDSQRPRERVLTEAVIFAEALRSNESISGMEFKTLVCSAMQDAVMGGMSPAVAVNIGGMSDCGGSFVNGSSGDVDVSAGSVDESAAYDDESSGDVGGSGGDVGGSGGHAPVTPIVVPSTTAGSNDSTSPTSN